MWQIFRTIDPRALRTTIFDYYPIYYVYQSSIYTHLLFPTLKSFIAPLRKPLHSRGFRKLLQLTRRREGNVNLTDNELATSWRPIMLRFAKFFISRYFRRIVSKIYRVHIDLKRWNLAMYFLNFSLIISSVDGLYPNPNFSLLLNIVARRPKSRVLYYQSLPDFGLSPQRLRLPLPKFSKQVLAFCQVWSIVSKILWTTITAKISRIYKESRILIYSHILYKM